MNTSKQSGQPSHFQNCQSGPHQTAQRYINSAQANLNKMLAEGKLSAEDYAKLVQKR